MFLALLCYPGSIAVPLWSPFCLCTKRELQGMISKAMRFSETLQWLYKQGEGLEPWESD